MNFLRGLFGKDKVVKAVFVVRSLYKLKNERVKRKMKLLFGGDAKFYEFSISTEQNQLITGYCDGRGERIRFIKRPVLRSWQKESDYHQLVKKQLMLFLREKRNQKERDDVADAVKRIVEYEERRKKREEQQSRENNRSHPYWKK